MDAESTPTLAPVPGVDLDDYRHTLIERFSNPQFRDTIARLCAESSDRIPKWLLPVIGENLAVGREIPRSAAVVASWARYAEGIDEQGPADRGGRPASGQPYGKRAATATTQTRSSRTERCSAIWSTTSGSSWLIDPR